LDEVGFAAHPVIVLVDELRSIRAKDLSETLKVAVEVADGDDLVDARPDALPAGGGRRRWR
jgi:hypothetical protein